jgi:transposase
MIGDMRQDRDDVTDLITDDAKPARVRHGAVLAGPERRRRWSLRQKLAIVAESLEAGAVVSQVAERHGQKPQQVFDWRRRLREDRIDGPRGKPADISGPAFVPVTVAPASIVADAAAEPVRSEIEISVGAFVVRFRGPVDAKILTDVLGAVKAAETYGRRR